MKKFFSFSLFAFWCLWIAFPMRQERIEELVAINDTTQQEVNEIDRQIDELKRMKRGYESRALQHQDAADRLQFEDQAYLETRRHLQLADENRLKAQKIQEEIDALQKEKEELSPK